MAEAITQNNEMNQTDLLASEAESAQQIMVELQQQQMKDDEVVIDMNQKGFTSEKSHQPMMEDGEMKTDLKAIMAEISEDGLSSPSCCIYRVPPMIRLLKEEAYTPRVVSIGPLHYGDARLQDMQRHKQVMFRRFTKNAMISMRDLESLVNFAKQSEPEVRACYFERSMGYSKKDLVKLILVDAAFIIGIFRGDIKLSSLWLRNAVFHDLLLLENQLPFSFLEGLFNIAFPPNLRGNQRSFLRLTYSFFNHLNLQGLKPPKNSNIKHFTDLLRLFYLPIRTKPPKRARFEGDGQDILLYSANELKEARVKLKETKSKCLLDLKFSGSVLQIPQFYVEDGTETLFRNIIALEQCHYPYQSYFTDYVVVLDRLINTSKDVEVLADKKIIRNWLSDADEVAALFNGLGRNIVLPNFNVEYLDICKGLNEFYHNPCHRGMATLRRDYCNTPWQTVASFAGFTLLILTLIQTIFSVRK